MQKPFLGDYPITQYYGEKITNPAGHTGIDFGLPLGTPIIAAADGTVIQSANQTDGYGQFVLLRHPDNLITCYAHLSAIFCLPGDVAIAGKWIANSGNSGNSSGPHLHFEVRKDGVCVNPDRYLSAENEQSGWAEVLCPQINIRSGPGITYPFVRQAPQGAKLPIFRQMHSVWAEVGCGQWAALCYQGEPLMRFDGMKGEKNE